MLDIKGCLMSSQSYTMSYFDLFEKRTGIALSNDEETFKKEMSTLWNIFQRFGIDSLSSFNQKPLTPIGDVIAQNYLKAHQFI
ncbi:hypothetical protein DVQ67_15920 [Yersinia enterocolitica]|nr:hypothetical protein [Yersinia enterocolitica]